MSEIIDFFKITISSYKFVQLAIFDCVVIRYSIAYHLVSHSFNLNVNLFARHLQHNIV